MPHDDALACLAAVLRGAPGLAAKREIAAAVVGLGLSAGGAVPAGDDCAAIPDGDGFTLFAIEGFISAFVAADPWFAGWCGVMVNVSDVLAMGGRPVAVVNAVWADGAEMAAPMLRGLRDACERFGVPMLGGHSNFRGGARQLSVAVLGRAKRLLTSFDGHPDDALVVAIDLRGRYREPFANWDAATTAPASRLRAAMEILPRLAEAGLAHAAKDISQAGLIGTACMLAECSGVGMRIDVDSVPIPDGVAPERWLQTFPSFGFLLCVPPIHCDDVIEAFHAEGIAAARVGVATSAPQVSIANGLRVETIMDLSAETLMGLGPRRAVPQTERLDA